MIENQKNKLPAMKADVGFSLGFFCGALLGAVGVYLAVSPEGKKLKTRLTSEFNEHQRTLILASLKQAGKNSTADIPEAAQKIRDLIKKIRQVTDKTVAKSTAKTQSGPIKRKHHFKQK